MTKCNLGRKGSVVINTMTKCNLGRKGFVLAHRLYSIMKTCQGRAPGRSLKQKPKRKQPRLSCLRNGTSHSGLGPPSSIVYQEDAPQTCPQTSLMVASPQVKFLLSRCVKLTANISQQPALHLCNLSSKEAETGTLRLTGQPG